MYSLIFLFKTVVYYGLEIVLLIMLIDAVLSWVRPASNRFTDFIIGFTATLCFPLRQLLWRFDSIRRCPLDIPFVLTWFLILSVQRLIF